MLTPRQFAMLAFGAAAGATAYLIIHQMTAAPPAIGKNPGAPPASIPTKAETALDRCAKARGGYESLNSVGTLQIRGTFVIPGSEPNNTTIYCDEFAGTERIYFYRDTPTQHSATSLVEGVGRNIKKPGKKAIVEILDKDSAADLSRMAKALYCLARFPLGDEYTETAPQTFRGKKTSVEVVVNENFDILQLTVPGGSTSGAVPEIWKFSGDATTSGIRFPKSIRVESGKHSWSLDVTQWGVHGHVTDDFYLGKTAGTGMKQMPASLPVDQKKPK
ncbi:MAG: hypothetical protein ACKVS6_12875 [Planctomycetota bacterium]